MCKSPEITRVLPLQSLHFSAPLQGIAEGSKFCGQETSQFWIDTVGFLMLHSGYVSLRSVWQSHAVVYKQWYRLLSSVYARTWDAFWFDPCVQVGLSCQGNS